MMPSGASARDEVLRRARHRGLRRGEADEPGALVTDRRRGDVHDARERRLAQQRQRGARRAHHREHAEVELVEPRVVGEVVEAADVRGADGVHERVALAPPLVEERERGFDLAGVEQVALRGRWRRSAPAARSSSSVSRRSARCARQHRDAARLRRRAAPRWRARRRACPPATTVGRVPAQSELASAASMLRQPPRQLAREVRGRERLAGRVGHERRPSAATRPARTRRVRGARRRRVRSTSPPARAVERGVELRREQLAVEVVLVVDGRGGEVDLGGPVGRVRGRRGGARAGSARRGPTRACRGRRRGRRTGAARSSSSPAPTGRTPAARRAGPRAAPARAPPTASSSTAGDVAQPRADRGRGGP